MILLQANGNCNFYINLRRAPFREAFSEHRGAYSWVRFKVLMKNKVEIGYKLNICSTTEKTRVNPNRVGQ
jgi:hypothetical protein